MKDNKLKIKYKQTNISDEEILVYKDFDGLLENHKKLNLFRNKKTYLLTSLILISGTFLLFTINYNSQQVSDLHHKEKFQNSLLTDEENKNTPPALSTSSERAVDSTEMSLKEADVIKEEVIKKEEVIEKKETSNIIAKRGVPKQEEPFITFAEADTINSNNEISTNISEYVDARPVDGYTALFEYFKDEMIYPEQAKNDELEGTVILEFTVTDAGKVIKVKINKGVSPEIDEEAIRLITRMPKWFPATVNGRKVKSKLSIPLNFRLERTTE